MESTECPISVIIVAISVEHGVNSLANVRCSVAAIATEREINFSAGESYRL
jgi:hypothetical protein